LKTCARCEKRKDLTEFSNNKYRSDGFNHYCRLCDSERRKLGAEKLEEVETKKLVRSVSLQTFNEDLHLARFKQVCDRYLTGRVTPAGHARKRPNKKAKRSVCLLLSDLHIGANLEGSDNPIPFGAVQEARRLEKVLRETLDYKSQYRDSQELVLLLNGDMIQGYLLHDLRSGAPLTEQMAAFWNYFATFIGACAQQYQSVRVVCQSGNHGRNKIRHHGRAVVQKWDGIEYQLYYGLRKMCEQLRNVTWDISFRAIAIVDLHGSKLGLTHGDTEVKIGHPYTAHERNAAILDRINSSNIYQTRFDAWAFGHFHTGLLVPKIITQVFNPALIPPDGHARTEGYISEPCGQALWEAVEGFPVGDFRVIRVDSKTDADETLGRLIKPFRFPLE
jgi:hypothetical protein